MFCSMIHPYGSLLDFLDVISTMPISPGIPSPSILRVNCQVSHCLASPRQTTPYLHQYRRAFWEFSSPASIEDIGQSPRSEEFLVWGPVSRHSQVYWDWDVTNIKCCVCADSNGDGFPDLPGTVPTLKVFPGWNWFLSQELKTFLLKCERV